MSELDLDALRRLNEDLQDPDAWTPETAADCANLMVRQLPAIVAALERAGAATADDIRAQGWTVAVHNDYQEHKSARTFWLVTHKESGRFLKGEGTTDAQALNQIRVALAVAPAEGA